MQDELSAISGKLINRIMTQYKKLSKALKINAIKKVESPSTQSYKIKLREVMAVIARESISMAKKEVPTRQKFSEYEDLPAKLKRQIDTRAALLVGTQLADLEKKLFFEFEEQVLNEVSENEIKSSLINKSDQYISGPAVNAAASQVAATVVNEARQAYFYTKESLKEIEAFVYKNEVPVSAICKELKGHVFRKDDPAAFRWTPPFHWNAILEGEYVTTSKGKKKIEDIHVGDKVLTHNYRFKEVTKFFTKFEDKNYYEIELESGHILKATGEHPIYSKQRGWIRVDEINLTDDIVTLKDIVDGFEV